MSRSARWVALYGKNGVTAVEVNPVVPTYFRYTWGVFQSAPLRRTMWKSMVPVSLVLFLLPVGISGFLPISFFCCSIMFFTLRQFVATAFFFSHFKAFHLTIMTPLWNLTPGHCATCTNVIQTFRPLLNFRCLVIINNSSLSLYLEWYCCFRKWPNNGRIHHDWSILR